MGNEAYLFIDPGDSKFGGVTGWATFSEQGNILNMGQFHSSVASKELHKLITPDLTKVVIEQFANQPWKPASARAWNKNETSQLIGKAKALCEILDIPWEEVPNTNFNIGYMYMGMEQPKNHAISHQWDAVAHGVYWLQTNGINPAGKFLKGKT